MALQMNVLDVMMAITYRKVNQHVQHAMSSVLHVRAMVKQILVHPVSQDMNQKMALIRYVHALMDIWTV